MGALDYLLIAVLAAVVAVLLMGVLSMARGGEASRKYSNKMMRWRVGLQFLAVIIIILMFFLRGG